MNELHESPGIFIFNDIKQKFQQSLFWTKEKEEILRKICYGIDVPNNSKDHAVIVEKLKQIKDVLISKDVAKEEDLKFLSEEIRIYSNNKIISEHVETNNEIPISIFNRYVNLHGNVEGIFSMEECMNIEQIRSIANESFKKNGKIKLYVSRQIKCKGQIILKKFKGLQEIIVASVYRRKLKGEYVEKVFLIDEKPERFWVKVRDMTENFFVYQFMSGGDEDILLLTKQKLDQGVFTVTGMSLKINDLVFIGDSGKLGIKKTLFFCQSVKSLITKYDCVETYKKSLNFFNVTKNNYFDYLFLINGKICNHPDWFKWLTWSWYLHAEIGANNPYPFHIMMVCIKGTGKTWLIDSLWDKSLEFQQPFSGVGGSVKGLVPSFATRNKPEIGYLAKCHRFAFLDELLKMFHKYKGNDVIEEVSQMNDMLEHKKRENATGNGSVEVNFGARVFCVGNPIQGMKMSNATDILKRFDESFCSRFLLYWQNKEHVNMIRTSDDDDLKKFSNVGNINKEEFIGFVDYLRSIKANFDNKKVSEIFEKYKPLLNGTLKDYYEARCKHHIKCVFDGLIKTRCFFEHDVRFNAVTEDYERLDSIWEKLVVSWIDGKDVKKMPLRLRLDYLPEHCRYMYEFARRQGSIFFSYDLKDIPEMSSYESREAQALLLDNGLFVEKSPGEYVLWENIEKQEKLE